MKKIILMISVVTFMFVAYSCNKENGSVPNQVKSNSSKIADGTINVCEGIWDGNYTDPIICFYDETVVCYIEVDEIDNGWAVGLYLNQNSTNKTYVYPGATLDSSQLCTSCAPTQTLYYINQHGVAGGYIATPFTTFEGEL